MKWERGEGEWGTGGSEELEGWAAEGATCDSVRKKRIRNIKGAHGGQRMHKGNFSVGEGERECQGRMTSFTR